MSTVDSLTPFDAEFPATVRGLEHATAHERAGINWCNGLTRIERLIWCGAADSCVPADAYRCYLELTAPSSNGK